MNSKEGKQVDFAKFTDPVIGFLAELGLQARFGGNNDIRIGDYKVSGNAEHVHRERVLHHGTLLFDADLEQLNACLEKGSAEYESHAVPSVPASVANIRDFLKDDMDLERFTSMLAHYLKDRFSAQVLTGLPGELSAEAETLAAEKYRTKEWIFGYSPPYTMHKSEGGNKLDLSVKKGLIAGARVRNSYGCVEEAREWLGEWHTPQNTVRLLAQYSHENILGKEELRTLLF